MHGVTMKKIVSFYPAPGLEFIPVRNVSSDYWDGTNRKVPDVGSILSRSLVYMF